MTYRYTRKTGDMDVENWEAGPGDGDVSVNLTGLGSAGSRRLADCKPAFI